MGINFDPPPGADNPSGIWEPGKTPKFLSVKVEGVQPCPGSHFSTGPPNRTFCLEQIDNRTWLWMGLWYHIFLYLGPLDSYFEINEEAAMETWFRHRDCPPGTLHFTNQLVCDPYTGSGFGGEATVDPEGAVCYPTVLMDSLNLFPDTSEVKWDPVGDPPIKTYVFGHKHNEIQCLIKHDGY